MLASGDLKHHITIQQATETQTAGSGALVASWGTFVERWAMFVRGTGREFMLAQSRHAEIELLVMMRGHCAVNEKMRVLMADGRVLEILEAWSPDGKACASAAEVWMSCREAS